MPDLSTATFLLAQGSWEVSWRAGYPPHPPSPPLGTLPLPFCDSQLPLFKGNSSSPLCITFLTKFHFSLLHLLSLYLFRVLSLGFQFLLRRLLHK